MTRLLIDGQEVALPPGFSSTLYKENPRYTKNGQYTYDITLSLNNFRNAKIYRHIDRINIQKGIQYKRSAILWIDNRIELNGTEIILGFTNSEVKIQLSSGNSELNFLIGGDNKLRDLDLGQAYVYNDLSPEDRTQRVLADLEKSYPEQNYQFIPYCVDDSKIEFSQEIFPRIGNSFHIVMYAGGNTFSVFDPFMSGAIPQPYLCFIIDKIIEVLGYKLVYNAIAAHPILKNIYIVHGFRTRFFAKMLPSWTVKEFFTELENWLDCSFIVNADDKSISLYFNYEIDTKDIGLKRITLVTKDEYSMEDDPENTMSVHNANIGYSLGSESYYQFMDLGNDIKRHPSVDLVHTSRTLAELMNSNSDNYNYIYSPKDTSDRFIVYQDGETKTLKKVDSFRPIYNNPNSEGLDIELKIIPAAMNYSPILLYASGNRRRFWFQVPIAVDADPLDNTDDKNNDPDNQPINIQSVVEENSSIEKDKSSSEMRVALYTGLQVMDIKEGGALSNDLKYPMPYVEALSEYFSESKKERYFGEKDLNPLRLSYLKSELYDKSKSIDTTKPFKFSFIVPDDFDIRSTFIIRNKEHICAKIEQGFTNDGFSKFALGYFYPKIKNKEA